MARKTKRVSRRKKAIKRVSRRKKAIKRVSRRKAVKRGGKGKTKSFVAILRKLSSLRPSQRVQAMKLANDKFIRDFCKHIKKLRHRRVTPNIQKQLRRQSKNLRKLVSAKTSIKMKRKMLSQRGSGALQRGLLGALAGAIAGALGRR